MNKKRARSAVVIYAIILIVGFLLINKWLGGSSNVATNYSYTEFSADLNAGNIAAVDITQNTNVPTATVDVEFVSGKQLTFYAADVNEIIKIYNDYEAAVDKKNATASAEDQVKLAKYNLYDVQKESMLWHVDPISDHYDHYGHYHDIHDRTNPGWWIRRTDDELRKEPCQEE